MLDHVRGTRDLELHVIDRRRHRHGQRPAGVEDSCHIIGTGEDAGAGAGAGTEAREENSTGSQ